MGNPFCGEKNNRKISADMSEVQEYMQPFCLYERRTGQIRLMGNKDCLTKGFSDELFPTASEYLESLQAKRATCSQGLSHARRFDVCNEFGEKLYSIGVNKTSPFLL